MNFRIRCRSFTVPQFTPDAVGSVPIFNTVFGGEGGSNFVMAITETLYSCVVRGPVACCVYCSPPSYGIGGAFFWLEEARCLIA